MDMQPKESAEEIKHLRRCLNNLVSILALPVIWSGGEPFQIAQTLLDTLLGMLSLDLVYVRLKGLAGEAPIQMVRVAQMREGLPGTEEICEALHGALGNDPQQWPSRMRNPIGDGNISILPLRLGLSDEMGVMVAGSQRAGFPEETDRLLLGVAANQAWIGLQEARRRSEQNRVASDLDVRVAERTRELAEANQELQLQVGLLQHFPVAAWTLDPDGTPNFVNRNWMEYTGQTLDYVRSNPEVWMAAIHPEDRESTSRSFWDGVRSGQGFVMEVRFRRVSDGTYRWHLNRAVALRDAGNKILRFVGTSTDIEDLKQSQAKSRRAEEQTRLIIDTALDAVVTIDAQGSITDWNKQAEIVFGWKHGEAIGRSMSEMIIPDHQRVAHGRGLHHFLATGDGPILRRRIEVTAVRRSGDEFPVELEVVPTRLGQDWTFSAFIRDITESKLAEQKLRASELNLRQMTETIPEMLWSATPQGAIDYCNARVLDYSGFSVEELMGNGWMKLLHPDDGDQAVREWMSCVATGAAYRVEVRIFRAADRMYRWCVMSALPLRDQPGRILKWYGTIVDMHDWKRAQEELRNMQAELAHVTRVMTMGELTASIAHEVNQPLAALVASGDSCAAWLAADPPNIAKARTAAERIVHAATQASEVVQRIRTMFRKSSSIRSPVTINEVIEEAISLIQSQLLSKRIALRTNLAENLPVVTGDRVQIEQVILNLAINGMEAMAEVDEPARWLFIQSQWAHRTEIQVSVADSGPGLDPSVAARLFDPFFTTKTDGIGMGLSISRSIIEAHGGRLWAAANQPHGAVFHFALPVVGASE